MAHYGQHARRAVLSRPASREASSGLTDSVCTEGRSECAEKSVNDGRILLAADPLIRALTLALSRILRKIHLVNVESFIIPL